VKRILLTGMSGTGKSTAIAALAERGFKAVDLDTDEWSEYLPVAAGDGVLGGLDLVWREDRLRELLTTEDAEVLFVSGSAPNQPRFYPWFDYIVLLSAPAEIMAERLTTRTNNPYGQQSGEVDRALQLKQTIEPRLRSAAHLEIDTSAALDEVLARILSLL
jgi:dephospho-CoA kinase